MKYPLNALTPTLTAIAQSIAAFDVNKEGYAEEIVTLAATIRQHCSVSEADAAMFASTLAIHALILAHDAERERQLKIDARAEKHARDMEKQAAIIVAAIKKLQ